MNKPRLPLPGHVFHTKSSHALRYIAADASAAAKSMQAIGDAKAEAKYLDQVNDASTVLNYRAKYKTC